MKEHAKKALKHDFEVAGKTVPTMLIAALFLIGGGSAAVLSSFGTVSGTADVEQAIEVAGNSGEATLGFFGADYEEAADITAGEITVDTFTVENNMNSSYSLSYDTDLDRNGNDVDSSTSTQIDWKNDQGEQVGIDTTFGNYFADAGADGANLDDYEAPDECSDSNTYGTADEVENNLGSHEVVCVDSDLSDRLIIDESGVTVASTQGPGNTEIDISGSSGPVVRINSDDVTFTGFTVAGATGGNEAGQGIDVNGQSSDRLSGVNLSYLEVTQNDDRALVLDYTDDSEVRHVHVHDNRGNVGDNEGQEGVSDGITFWHTDDSKVAHATVNDNSDNGVYFQGTGNKVTDVESYGNADQGIDISADRDGNEAGTTLENVTVYENDAAGIEVEDNEQEVGVTGAVVYDNNQNGDYAQSVVVTADNGDSADNADVVVKDSRLHGAVKNQGSDDFHGSLVADNNFFPNGIDTRGSGDVSASFQEVSSVPANSQVTVGALNEFDIMINGADDYTLTTTIS